MSDALPDDTLPAWAVDLLAAPPPASPDELARARAHVMAAVRRAPRHGRPLARGLRLPHAAPRWARRRGLLAPGGALAAAALVAALAGGAGLRPTDGARGLAADAVVLGDTVLGDTVLGDTVLGAATLGRAVLGRAAAGGAAVGDVVRDTLRVVRFALAGPGPDARVTLAGDFTGWRPAPLGRDARTGRWSVTLAVPRDAVRSAFVVEAEGGARRWVPGPSLPAAPAGALRTAGAGDST
jgi:hypothetical protein